MTDLPKIDWQAERDAMKAPAYFARHAQASEAGRGLSPEERGAKTQRSRERLSDVEIERLNAARSQNGGDVL